MIKLKEKTLDKMVGYGSLFATCILIAFIIFIFSSCSSAKNTSRSGGEYLEILYIYDVNNIDTLKYEKQIKEIIK